MSDEESKRKAEIISLRNEQEGTPLPCNRQGETEAETLESILGPFILTEEDVEGIGEEKFIIPDLIIEGHMVVIVAEPGGGKTALMMHYAPKIVEQGYQLIYFNFDASPQDLKKHYARSDRQGYRIIAPDRKLGVTNEDAIAALERLATLGDLNNVVVVLDTLKKCVELIVKNKARAFFGMLRTLSGAGATIVALGHANKHRDSEGNLVFEGTNDVRADVDELIYLEAVKDSIRNRQTISSITDGHAKVRGIFRNKTWEMDTKSREVWEQESYTDVGRILEAEERIRKRDADGSLRRTIIEAIDKGIVVQSRIIDYCKSKHFSGNAAKDMLKDGVRLDNPLKFLTCKPCPKEHNAKVYDYHSNKLIGVVREGR